MGRKAVKSGKFHQTSIYACARFGFPPKFSELSNRSDNGMHRQEPPGVTQSSPLVWWRSSPPVTRDTGVRIPDGEAVLNLFYCFGPGLSRRKAKRRAICIGRESKRTLKTRERVRFHRDLNSDRWIQSPEC